MKIWHLLFTDWLRQIGTLIFLTGLHVAFLFSEGRERDRELNFKIKKIFKKKKSVKFLCLFLKNQWFKNFNVLLFVICGKLNF
jgi:hypothetical protein